MQPVFQGKTMAEYKLYLLGPTGMIARGVWFDRDTDAEAIAEANKRATGAAMELWSGERLVRSFEATRQAG